MRKKLAVLAIVVGMLMTMLALPAQAKNCGTSHGSPCTIAPSGGISCPAGYSVYLKAYSYDFLWFDSTGYLVFRWRTNGTTYSFRQPRSGQGEMDGVIKKAYLAPDHIDWASVTYYNVWGGGAVQFTTHCW